MMWLDWKEIDWIWHGYARKWIYKGKEDKEKQGNEKYMDCERRNCWTDVLIFVQWVSCQGILVFIFENKTYLFKKRNDVTGLKGNGVNYDIDICWLLYINEWIERERKCKVMACERRIEQKFWYLYINNFMPKAFCSLQIPCMSWKCIFRYIIYQ